MWTERLELLRLRISLGYFPLPFLAVFFLFLFLFEDLSGNGFSFGANLVRISLPQYKPLRAVVIVIVVGEGVAL